MFEFTNEVWKRLIWSGLTVLAGLILSAYRFDTVLEEKKEPGATSSGSGR